MKRLIKWLLPVLLSAVVFSCHRKELESADLFYAYVPISIDWSNSLLDLSEVGNVSVYFYPVGGGDPIVKMSSDLYYKFVELPMGEYNVLVFNDLAHNVKGVTFNDVYDYDNFHVSYTESLSTSPYFYDLLSDEVMVTDHSRVASWSLENFVVDVSMIEYTRSTEFEAYIEEVKSKSLSRSKSALSGVTDSSLDVDASLSMLETRSDLTKAATKALSDMSNVTPEPATAILDVRVRVQNLNNAAQFEAIVRGMGEGTYMSNRTSIESGDNTLVYSQIVANREYDDEDNGIDGYVNFTLNTFGRTSTDESYTFNFQIVLQSGELAQFERDVTSQMLLDNDGTIEIDLTTSAYELSLPEYGEPGFSVSGWGDDVIIDL